MMKVVNSTKVMKYALLVTYVAEVLPYAYITLPQSSPVEHFTSIIIALWKLSNPYIEFWYSGSKLIPLNIRHPINANRIYSSISSKKTFAIEGNPKSRVSIILRSSPKGLFLTSLAVLTSLKIAKPEAILDACGYTPYTDSMLKMTSTMSS